jgi:hypothetical protein
MNRVELTHTDPTMIVRAKEAATRGEFLQEFIPCPKELKDTIAGSVGDADEQKKLVERTQLNIKNHGYGNWYDFCVAEWGTKWDIKADGDIFQEGDNDISFTFDSAWSPPITAYERLVEQGFEVRATYYEPGMCFCGVWEDGYDDFYDYSSMSADEVGENIPDALDEEYGISDGLRDMEEQEEDEE